METKHKPITTDELADMKRRADGATEGPWQVADTTDGAYILDDGDLIITANCERDNDAEFIASARTDMPRLIAEVERLRGIMRSTPVYMALKWYRDTAKYSFEGEKWTQYIKAVEEAGKRD
jgi:hypothetical protein